MSIINRVNDSVTNGVRRSPVGQPVVEVNRVRVTSTIFRGVVINDRQSTKSINSTRMIKVRLWVLMHDLTLTHLSADISLIP